MPQDYALYKNFPNPFNPSTTIEYTVSELFKESVRVDLIIYNIYGQLVRRLERTDKTPGVYAVVWDGKDEFGSAVASGAYIYRLRVGDFVASKRMTLLK